MNQKIVRQRVRSLFAAALMWAATGCSVRAVLTPIHLDEYRGDGSILRVNLRANPGVLVRFESFEISRPYSATYRLNGLPSRPHPYVIELIVPYPENWKASVNDHGLFFVPGVLSIRLLDESRAIIFECDGKPGWGGAFGRDVRQAKVGFGTCPGVRGDQPYIMASDIVKDEGRALRLELEWKPERDNQRAEAWLQVQSGGTK